MAEEQEPREPPAKLKKKDIVALKKLSDTQIESLICEVQCRSSLWNDKDNNFKNTTLTRKLWDEVGAAFDMSGDHTKKKWKNLKDKFRREISKPPSRSGSGAVSAKGKWRFTELMQFTRDTIAPAKMVGSLSTTDSISNDEENEDLLEDMGEGEKVDGPNPLTFEVQEETPPIRKPTSSPANSTSTNNSNLFRARPHRGKSATFSKTDVEQEMIQLEKQKINAILNIQKKNEKPQEDGDDYYFLMSLLPYIKPLDPLLKLELRGKIQNEVMQSYRLNQNHCAPQLLTFDRPASNNNSFNRSSVEQMLSPSTSEDLPSRSSSSSSSRFQFTQSNLNIGLPIQHHQLTSQRLGLDRQATQKTRTNSFNTQNTLNNRLMSSVGEFNTTSDSSDLYKESQLNSTLEDQVDFTTNTFMRAFCNNK